MRLSAFIATGINHCSISRVISLLRFFSVFLFLFLLAGRVAIADETDQRLGEIEPPVSAFLKIEPYYRNDCNSVDSEFERLGNHVTGFFVDTEGRILTNRHILDQRHRGLIKNRNKRCHYEFRASIGDAENYSTRLKYLDHSDEHDLMLFNVETDENFQHLIIAFTSQISPQLDLSTKGFPASDREETNKPTSTAFDLRHTCTAEDALCIVNENLDGGRSGSPVFLRNARNKNGGIIVLGVIKSEARATVSEERVHFVNLSNSSVQKFLNSNDVNVTPASELIQNPNSIPLTELLAVDMNDALWCDLSESSFIPFLNNRLHSIAEFNDFSGSVSTQTALPFIGQLVDGFENLYHIKATEVQCNVDVFPINPTVESRPNKVSVLANHSKTVLDTTVVFPAGEYQIDGTSENLSAQKKYKIERPGQVILDRNNLELNLRLLDTVQRSEALFLFDEVLVGNISEEQLIEGDVDADSRFSGKGLVLGAKMNEYQQYRWFDEDTTKAKAKTLQTDLLSSAFISQYNKFVNFRPDEHLYKVRKKDSGGFEISFDSPFLGDPKIIFPSSVRPQAYTYSEDSTKVFENIDGSDIEVGAIWNNRVVINKDSALIGPETNGLDFIVNSNANSYAFRLRLQSRPDPKQPNIDIAGNRSFASLMITVPRKINEMQTLKDRATLEKEVSRIRSVSNQVLRNITTLPETDNSTTFHTTYDFADPRFDPFSKVDSEQISILESSILATNGKTLTERQQETEEYAVMLLEWLRSKTPVDDALIQQWENGSGKMRQLELGYVTQALQLLQTGKILDGTKKIESALSVTDYRRDVAIRREEKSVVEDIDNFHNYLVGTYVNALYTLWQAREGLNCDDDGLQDTASEACSIDPDDLRDQLIATLKEHPPQGKDIESRITLNWKGAKFTPNSPPSPWFTNSYGHQLTRLEKIASFIGIEPREPHCGRSIGGLSPSDEFIFDREGNTARLKTNESSISVSRPIRVNAYNYPKISFRWKVNHLPSNGDARKCEFDDQAIQLLVAFEDRSHKFHTLAYVWDANAPVGSTACRKVGAGDDRLHYLVVQSGTDNIGEWVTEERNLYEDVTVAFDHSNQAPGDDCFNKNEKLEHESDIEPDDILGISIQSNSQWTRDKTDAEIGEIVFLGR